MKQMVSSTLAMKVGSWGETGLCHIVSGFPFPWLVLGFQELVTTKRAEVPWAPKHETAPTPIEGVLCQRTDVKSACSVSSNKIRRGIR
jgi:hypothetical protein